jgi:ribonucleoside-diphosphate reductase alpha chain
MLKALDLQYASPEARELAENVFSFINYVSKKESLELAKQRGPFESFAESKYVTGGDLISAYSKRETGSVAGEMWRELIRDVQKWGLRNCATIAIPPTGRSSHIIGASPSIEPFFREILDVSPEEQLRMVESIQRFTDESISKTVNIPETSSVSDIKEILRMAMRMGIKGITIYRDKSRELQPQKI